MFYLSEFYHNILMHLILLTFDLIIDTVSFGISERGMAVCSSNLSSLHFSTSPIFFSSNSSSLLVKIPSSGISLFLI